MSTILPSPKQKNIKYGGKKIGNTDAERSLATYQFEENFPRDDCDYLKQDSVRNASKQHGSEPSSD
jgi:hypothetical protein